MKIFLTGATGYLGRHVLEDLLKSGHSIKILARDPTKIPKTSAIVTPIKGDATLLETFTNELKDCDAVVQLISIIEEKKQHGITFQKLNVGTTQNLINAAKENGVKRFIYMSALGTKANDLTPYFRTKWQAEQEIINSGLYYTIFRPSFIFGYNHPVYSMLISLLKKSPFGLMPIFGDGKYKHQPVFVKNIAELVSQALTNPATENKEYDVGGPQQLTYLQQLEIIANLLSKKLRPVFVPLDFSKMMIKAASLLPFSPIDSSRLKMLTQDNICDITPLQITFDVEWVRFQDGLKTMLQ